MKGKRKKYKEKKQKKNKEKYKVPIAILNLVNESSTVVHASRHRTEACPFYSTVTHRWYMTESTRSAAEKRSATMKAKFKHIKKTKRLIRSLHTGGYYRTVREALTAKGRVESWDSFRDSELGGIVQADNAFLLGQNSKRLLRKTIGKNGKRVIVFRKRARERTTGVVHSKE